MLRVQIGLNFILKFCPFRQFESPISLHGTYKEGLVCPFPKEYFANSTQIAQNTRQKLRVSEFQVLIPCPYIAIFKIFLNILLLYIVVYLYIKFEHTALIF